MRSFNIADLFELTAGAIPDRLSLVAGDVRLTYGELDDRAARAANALRALGVGPGDHVAILAGTRAEWLEVMLGCFMARAVPVNINYRYTRDEILYVLNDADVVALVVEDDLARMHPGLETDVATLRGVLVIGGAAGQADDYEHALASASGDRADGDAIARLVEAELPRLLVLVGDAMALPFLDAIDDGDHDLSSIGAIASGGAMLSPVTKARLEKALPGVLIVDGFGASETGSSGTMVGSSGGSSLPRFSVGPDVAVLDERLRPVAVGETGRLARSGRVPLGYWKDPEKTAATFPTDPDGKRWAVPGDLARLEEDGTLTLLGRGSSCINTGGEKVHPDEVAHAIKAHPQVADALVVGIPDPRFGQAVAALVAGPAPVSDESLRDHLRPTLAGYKLPRRIVWVPEIRYTPQGKPDLAWATDAAQAAEA